MKKLLKVPFIIVHLIIIGEGLNFVINGVKMNSSYTLTTDDGVKVRL